MPYDKLSKVIVNRKDGTLTIKKNESCRAARRNDMQCLLEEMAELDRQIHVGKRAEIKIKKLEEQFRELCKLEIEEVQDERD